AAPSTTRTPLRRGSIPALPRPAGRSARGRFNPRRSDRLAGRGRRTGNAVSGYTPLRGFESLSLRAVAANTLICVADRLAATIRRRASLARLTGAVLVRGLQHLGWAVVVQRGSHVQLRHPERGGRVTVPCMPAKSSGLGSPRRFSSRRGSIPTSCAACC